MLSRSARSISQIRLQLDGERRFPERVWQVVEPWMIKMLELGTNSMTAAQESFERWKMITASELQPTVCGSLRYPQLTDP